MLRLVDIIPAFLTACPGLRPAWEDRLREQTAEDTPAGDLGVVARYLAARMEEDALAEVGPVCGVLERCITEGDEEARRAVFLVLLADLRRLLGQRTSLRAALEVSLGPYTRALWDGLPDADRMLGEGLGSWIAAPKQRGSGG
jgi:hypothetical protein